MDGRPVALAAGFASYGGPRRSPSAAPLPSRPDRDPASCATCHEAIAEEWRASFHRVAYSDVTFQASLALENERDRAFCVACHGPHRETTESPSGIECLDCHAHAHAAAPAHDTSSGCAPCHEFTFPGRTERMQSTLSEHAASHPGSTTCVSCHMPLRDGHRDHRFTGGHDARSVAAAVRVSGE